MQNETAIFNLHGLLLPASFLIDVLVLPCRLGVPILNAFVPEQTCSASFHWATQQKEASLSKLLCGDGGGLVCVQLLVLVLQLVELVVEPAQRQQLLMGSLFAQLALVHDEDGVRALDR